MALQNLHAWLAEPLLRRPGAQMRRMFGAHSIYLDGVLYLVLADGEEPWNGLLFPAERFQHPAILEEFPFLTPHAILPKWLYLTAEDDAFEQYGQRLVTRLCALDPRFGVLPKPRKKRKTTKQKAKDAVPPPSDPADPRPPHLR
jgi:hypothetical protein